MLGRNRLASLWQGDDEDDDEEFFEGFKKVDIPEDAYGAAILAFVRELPEVMSGCSDSKGTWELAFFGLIFSIVLLVANLMLQCAMMAFVYRYVVSTDIRGVQQRFKDFRLNAFDSTGAFREDLWEQYPGKTRLCQVAMWNRPFYYSVLFCWSLVMMIEIRKSEELMRHTLKMPVCDEPSKMLIERGGDRYIVAFTPRTRALIMFCVCVPKIGISITLLWLGCEWLSATIEFESLVMNTVAMAFIVSIDEVLFEAILPHHYRDDVGNIDFLIPRHDKSDTLYWDDKKRSAFRKSTFTMGFACVLIVLFAEYFQDVLPADITVVKDHCQDLMARTQQPFCNGWTWYLRGNPSARQCFPFRKKEEPMIPSPAVWAA